MADHVHESWWLIESTYAPTRTLYYAGHRKVGERLAPHMVDDPAKAVRWPDDWGAKYALAAMSGVKVNTPMWPLELMGYAVREHIFDYTPPGVPVSQPTEQEAHDIGAKGAPATERERLLFEAWMRGHCWALCATWDGKQYISDAEQGGDLDPRAMATRRLFAAWRDRAALGVTDMGNNEETGR